MTSITDFPVFALRFHVGDGIFASDLTSEDDPNRQRISMSLNIDDFGVVSNGLDRAEIGLSPPVDAKANLRPEVKATEYHKTSVHKTIGDTFPNILIHPQHGIRRIKRAIKEKNAESPVVNEHVPFVPVLAPEPPLALGEERLKESPDEETKLPSLQAFVHHPVSALKSVATDQGGGEFAAAIAKSEVSHSAEVRLLLQDKSIKDAHEDQVKAEQETYIQHKYARQDAFVRWSIDRHVRRVAVYTEPALPGPRPSFRAPVKEWKAYGSKMLTYGLEQHGDDYIDLSPEWTKPTQALLSSSFERIVVASTPLQSLFIQLRDISHWKSPRKSAAWMILYFVCLIYDQITRMAIMLLIISVVYRRWHPPTVQEMHESVAATEDKTVKAHTLSQLIIKYGTKGWVNEIIDQAGPMLLHNSEQAAATLERMQNFYEWRNPYRTCVTLSILAALWTLITFTPTWLLVQMSFFGVGFMFFVLEPIGSRFPRYRLLTSPFTLLMWKVPTHAEWAIARLQAEAAQQTTLVASSTNDQKEASTAPLIIGYFNYEGDLPGRLTVTTASLSCSPDTSKENGWTLPFSDLRSMHKNKLARKISKAFFLCPNLENNIIYLA